MFLSYPVKRNKLHKADVGYCMHSDVYIIQSNSKGDATKETHGYMFVCQLFPLFHIALFSFTHSFSFIYPLFIEPLSMDHDLERCPILARSTRPRRRHIARRHALFALLVMACIICVYMSYQVSSSGQLPCSNYFVWIPNCNKEQYYVLPS